jgi:hypothetical protein
MKISIVFKFTAVPSLTKDFNDSRTGEVAQIFHSLSRIITRFIESITLLVILVQT